MRTIERIITSINESTRIAGGLLIFVNSSTRVEREGAAL